MRTNSMRNGPSWMGAASGSASRSSAARSRPVLVELRLDEPEGEACRPDLLDADFTHQVRERADVVLVRVRQDDGANGAVVEVAEVGRMRSTPRCSSRGNDIPASTTIRSSPISKTVMFFPTSPSPPSGMIPRGGHRGSSIRRWGREMVRDPGSLAGGEIGAVPRTRELPLLPLQGEGNTAVSSHNVPMRRISLILLFMTAALSVAVNGSASGSNTPTLGQNVDPSLVTSITGSGSPNGNGGGNDNSTYHVLVFGGGPSLNPGGNQFGINWRRNLPNVGAQSATLTASQIAQLSNDHDVQYIAPDTPMAPTGKRQRELELDPFRPYS